MSRSVLLAHPGTQYSLHLARELHRQSELGGFHTCLALSAESGLARVLSPVASALGVERQWQNRLLKGVPAKMVYRYPSLEINAWWQMRRRSVCARLILRERNDRFQNLIPESAIQSARVVIGFDTSSHILASRTQAQGRRFILDRSIAHPRSFARLAEKLKESFPEWEDAREIKSDGELAIEDEEHALAHLIVVPSRFVADTLIEHDVPFEKIRVNPFGTDTASFHPAAEAREASPFIFLFVGALMARKGLPLLLEAWRRLRPRKAELWIAGTGQIPSPARRDAPESVRWLGAISREELPDLFRRAHVFVFPSFFEGLAQVQVEAAACGLPIIATTASGGEEIVTEGQTGFIIEAGNSDQLVERMHQFIERPALAFEMRERAVKRAARWSWSNYGGRWQKIIRECA